MKLVPIFLWSERAPGAVGDQPEDRPTLTPYIPEHPTGSAMIVCPGGGYQVVVDHEQAPVAEWLNKQGITAYVLNYRVAPRYRHPAMWHDVARAVRIVRAQATEWKIDSGRIGVIGFSAGGHLAGTLAVHHDAGNPQALDPVERVSSRPDLSVLVYPVITMQSTAGRPGKSKNLMGVDPSDELVEKLSLERQVTKTTPCAFIYHRRGDGTVPLQHSLLYAAALAEANIPFELHVYDHIGHGQVWAPGDPIDGDWPERLANWLRRHSF